MTTCSSIFVSHGSEGDEEPPFTVKMVLKPNKSDAGRLLKSFCKVRNGKRSVGIDVETHMLSLTADGKDPIDPKEDVRFLFDSEDGIAFVVPRPPKAAPLKKGFLQSAPAAKAAKAPQAKPKATKLKGGFFNSKSPTKKAVADPRSAAATKSSQKISEKDETYAFTPSIQLQPWTQARATNAGAKEFRDANVRELSHRVADIDMKIDAWANSVASTRREPTAPVVQQKSDLD